MISVEVAIKTSEGSIVSKKHGDSVSFTCTADGFPRPKVIWRLNGQPLLTNSSRRMITYAYDDQGFRSIPKVKQISIHLNISDLSGADNGSYSCRADNEARMPVVMTEPFTLRVEGLYHYVPCNNYDYYHAYL